MAVTDDTMTRKVVDVSSCNQCHEKLALHGGGRVDTQYCALCHNPNTIDEKTAKTVDLKVMVHKIHAGEHLKDWFGEDYTIQTDSFAEVGFPQDLRNCTKCHDNTKAPQADNWKNVPSRAACGACHAGINFATGTGLTIKDAEAGMTSSTYGHVGGVQTDDSVCRLCHSPTVIPVQHTNEIASTYNPTTKAGLVNFTYEIKSADVDASNNLSVVFRINTDGTPLTTLAPTGFTGGPGFLLAWAVSQDGITSPADFNNTINTKGDATSISIAALRAGTGGNSVSGAADADGYFTATIVSANAFPAGAKMRTVALQSYWTQSAGTNDIAAASGRHATSVVKTVTGDTGRRLVIDSAKCSNCHEWLELHGGSRVIGKETTGLYVCAMCHVPAKATSGRGISDATVNTYAAAGRFSAHDLEILTAWGVTPTTFPVTVGSNWALQLPVTSNNMKDMIHGFHRGSGRETPFQDARDRTPSAITLFDESEFQFPGILKNCETCHLPGTYSSVPADALASTYESKDANGNTTTAFAKAALSKPNPEDIVTSPFAAVCVSCHDKTSQKTHMGQNGGQIMVARSAFVTPTQESCPLCHGVGKLADITVVHKR